MQVIASPDITITMIAVTVIVAAIFFYRLFTTYMTDVTPYKRIIENLKQATANTKMPFIIEKEPTGGIDISFIYLIKNFTRQELDDFYAAYDLLEEKFKTMKYEIILTVDDHVKKIGGKLAVLSNKKYPKITCISMTNHGISYWISAGIRCKGKLIVDYQYFQYISKFGATKSKQTASFINFKNNDPLPGYNPEDFYALATITYGAFHSVFDRVHTLSVASTHELMQHCKAQKIQVEVIEADSNIEIGIQDIWFRKISIWWIQLLYWLSFYKGAPSK